MTGFKNTYTYKYGYICGYIYILTILAVFIVQKSHEAGILKTTGYWGIFEHPETMAVYFGVVLMLALCLIIIPNLGLGICLWELQNENIKYSKTETNIIIDILNTLSFVFYAWVSILLLLANCFAPPFIPVILFLIYLISKVIKVKKDV